MVMTNKHSNHLLGYEAALQTPQVFPLDKRMNPF